MGDLVNAISALTPGIQTRFSMMYGNIWKANLARYAPGIMDFAVPSNGAYEIYHRFESAPHAKRWPRGATRSSKGFKGAQYTVYNHDWENGVEAHEDDVMDDRTGMIENRAQDAGGNAARVPVRVIMQIDGAQSNPDLLPFVPNAPDGAAMFSATAGDSSDRFGISGGNVITGSGVATVGAIQTDYAAAIVRAKSFLDTEGQPYYPDDMEEQGITILAGVANLFVIRKAFEQMMPTIVVRNVAGTENVAAAAESNAIKDGVLAKPAQIILNPYKTGNDWSVYFHAAPVKPMFQQTRQGLQYVNANRFNNGDCLKNKTVGWYWDWREGYGVNDPVGAVKVDN